MRHIINTLVVFALCGCVLSPASNSNAQTNNAVEDSNTEKKVDLKPEPPLIDGKYYAVFDVGNFTLKLKDWKGNCALTSVNKKTKKEKTHFVNMESPCNFVRAPGKTENILTYTFGKGDKKNETALIVGGKPNPKHPDYKDEFFPNGCGIELDKVFVFNDRVEVKMWGYGEEPPEGSEHAYPKCPSYGGDEVEFAFLFDRPTLTGHFS